MLGLSEGAVCSSPYTGTLTLVINKITNGLHTIYVAYRSASRLGNRWPDRLLLYVLFHGGNEDYVERNDKLWGGCS